MKRIAGLLLAFLIYTGIALALISPMDIKAADGNIASGTSGTCSWVIDNDGTLIISPLSVSGGTLASYNDLSGSGPWFDYRTQIKKVVVNPGVIAGAGCYRLFNNFTNCTEMQLGNLDTSNVTNMGNMFYNCSGLTSLDLSGWVTDKVTNMSYMFRGCSGLTSLDISGFNTGSVTNMYYMFYNCRNVQALNVSGWNTANVTNMGCMFYCCYGLTTLDLSGFDTSNATYMANMLYDCYRIKSIKLGENFSFKGKNITSTGSMAKLPGIAGTYITGKWIREDGAYGPYTSEELRDAYEPSMAGTWILEKKQVEYTVSFEGDEASGSMPNVTAENVVAFTIPDNAFKKYGYVFDHWDDGSGNTYKNGDSIPVNRYPAGTNVVLTAVWNKLDTSVQMEDGAFEFSIKAGEKADFGEIPAGTSYQVYELTPEGWVLVQQENTSGVIEPLEESTASFWNKYQPGVVTAQFTGIKQLDGRPAAEGSYSFELLDENRNVLQTKSVMNGGFIQFDPIEYTKADIGIHTYYVRETDPQDDSIDYDTHEEVITVNVRNDKAHVVLHTDNLDADGNQLGTSALTKMDTVTIPGAQSIHVSLRMGGGDCYIMGGEVFEMYSASSGEEITQELEVDGDSLTVLYSPAAGEPNYGYYIVADADEAGKTFAVTSAEVIYDEDGIAFANKTRPGSLHLTKKAEGLTDANSDDVFTFDIHLYSENGLPSEENIYWYIENADS